MKILAFTDIHSAYQKVQKIIESEKFDILVIGGDITNVGTLGEVRTNLSNWEKFARQLLAVVGNMDLPQHDNLILELGYSINGRGIIIEDVGFFGCSAAPISPLRTPYEINESRITEILQRGYEAVKDAKYKVLVSHSPPYGTKLDIIHSGIHVGSTAVRDFIENSKIDLVICGHIHEGRGTDLLYNTKIVNCGTAAKMQYATIEILDNQINITNHTARY